MAQLEGVIEGGAVINVEIIGTGPQGRDGYTPIKGVDYFTPSEVASIESNAAQMAAAAASQDIAAETRRAMEAEDNRIKKFYTNNLGSVSVADSDDGAVRNLVVGGKSEQGADPSPGNPQEIKSVENCTMTVSNADGSNAQTVPIPFVLRGIGDVRDELYVYADGSGKLIQRIGLETFDDTTGGMKMLYNTLKKLKARGGLTADLIHKVDVFFALGKLTEAEYNDLLDVGTDVVG